MVDAAKRRFEAGDIAQAEVFRAAFERDQARRAIFVSQNRVDAALLSFNRLLAQPLDTKIQVVDDGWLFPTGSALGGADWELPQLETLREEARQHRPDLKLVAQQDQTAQRRIKLALANQSPDVTLQASLLWNPVTSGFTYLAGVQVELPWGSDRGGEVEQAMARQQETVLRQKAALATADHAVVLAWTNFQNARQQLRHDLEVLQPQADRVQLLAEKIYQIGQGDITEVLTVGQSVQRQRQLLLVDVARLHQTLGELELAVNRNLVGVKP